MILGSRAWLSTCTMIAICVLDVYFNDAANTDGLWFVSTVAFFDLAAMGLYHSSPHGYNGCQSTPVGIPYAQTHPARRPRNKPYLVACVQGRQLVLCAQQFGSCTSDPRIMWATPPSALPLPARRGSMICSSTARWTSQQLFGYIGENTVALESRRLQ